jgi:hypothetical protein
MKGKLIKKDDGYNLTTEQPQGRLLEATCSPSQQLILNKSGASTKYKLSKQNCDEIFGVVDVEKLAEEYARTAHDIMDEPYQNGLFYGFMAGFNKSMELNKDKVFILEDIKKVFAKTIENSPSMESHTRMISDMEYRHFIMNEIYDKITQSIQQPTEIDVDIEMKKVVDETKVIGAVKGVKGSGDKITTYKSIPKLDSEGCLILKKI